MITSIDNDFLFNCLLIFFSTLILKQTKKNKGTHSIKKTYLPERSWSDRKDDSKEPEK